MVNSSLHEWGEVTRNSNFKDGVPVRIAKVSPGVHLIDKTKRYFQSKKQKNKSRDTKRQQKRQNMLKYAIFWADFDRPKQTKPFFSFVSKERFLRLKEFPNRNES